jgi:hypothetical protein
VAWPELIAAVNGALVDTLGEPTTYAPASGGPVTAKGIVDMAYVRVDVGTAGASSSAPAVFYRLADLPIDPDDDNPEITINGRSYEVIEVQKDGQGGVLLLLHRLT